MMGWFRSQMSRDIGRVFGSRPRWSRSTRRLCNGDSLDVQIAAVGEQLPAPLGIGAPLTKCCWHAWDLGTWPGCWCGLHAVLCVLFHPVHKFARLQLALLCAHAVCRRIPMRLDFYFSFLEDLNCTEGVILWEDVAFETVWMNFESLIHFWCLRFLPFLCGQKSFFKIILLMWKCL